jgi:hypothetical protein
MKVANSPWFPEASSKVDVVEHNQLWNDHLLAVALSNHARSPYSHGALKLVRHGGGLQCDQVVQGYSRLLRTEDKTFLDMTLSDLVATWRKAVSDGPHGEWLETFHRRYVDVEESTQP